MHLKNQLGVRLKELRKLNKLSQEQLAEIVGVDPKHISFLENGKNFPSANLLMNLVKALKIEIKELFSFEHQMNRDQIIENLNSLIEKMDDKKLKFIYKMALELEK